MSTAPRLIRLRERSAPRDAERPTGARHWKPFSTQRAFLELVRARRRRRQRLH